MQKVDHEIGIQEKRQFFALKEPKISENSDHVMGPSSIFFSTTPVYVITKWVRHGYDWQSNRWKDKTNISSAL
jgi:hypothetical protein